ncbi:MAG TPA: 2-hydroxyhepta-2,4-diene-1,7-dioate isomerase [Porphyromonadaceae bacterium]|nr:2-hydroxyhepta-2,4-diene-1,7-dioate isomerase [Porphyromonadaceae bacterium]
MKCICIGWNYPLHNEELEHRTLPRVPTLFMKPDSAQLNRGKPFFIPEFSNQIEYEAELIVRINRLGKYIEERFAHRYYEEVGVGIDFTARDLQYQQRKEGQPWEIAKAFDNSAVYGDFLQKDTLPPIDQLHFSLQLNGKEVQRGFTGDMLFSVDKAIAYASTFFTLKMGDIIYMGTPPGVGKVAIDDHLEGYLEGKKVLDFYVR